MKRIKEQFAENLKNAVDAIQKVKDSLGALERATRNSDRVIDSWMAKAMQSEYTVAFVVGGFFAAMMVGVFIGMQIN